MSDREGLEKLDRFSDTGHGLRKHPRGDWINRTEALSLLAAGTGGPGLRVAVETFRLERGKHAGPHYQPTPENPDGTIHTCVQCWEAYNKAEANLDAVFARQADESGLRGVLEVVRDYIRDVGHSKHCDILTTHGEMGCSCGYRERVFLAIDAALGEGEKNGN